MQFLCSFVLVYKVTMFCECYVAVMDVKAFERLLGPCMDIMKRNIQNYEEQLVALFGSSTDIELTA